MAVAREQDIDIRISGTDEVSPAIVQINNSFNTLNTSIKNVGHQASKVGRVLHTVFRGVAVSTEKSIGGTVKALKLVAATLNQPAPRMFFAQVFDGAVKSTQEIQKLTDTFKAFKDLNKTVSFKDSILGALPGNSVKRTQVRARKGFENIGRASLRSITSRLEKEGEKAGGKVGLVMGKMISKSIAKVAKDNFGNLVTDFVRKDIERISQLSSPDKIKAIGQRFNQANRLRKVVDSPERYASEKLADNFVGITESLKNNKTLIQGTRRLINAIDTTEQALGRKIELPGVLKGLQKQASNVAKVQSVLGKTRRDDSSFGWMPDVPSMIRGAVDRKALQRQQQEQTVVTKNTAATIKKIIAPAFFEFQKEVVDETLKGATDTFVDSVLNADAPGFKELSKQAQKRQKQVTEEREKALKKFRASDSRVKSQFSSDGEGFGGEFTEKDNQVLQDRSDALSALIRKNKELNKSKRVADRYNRRVARLERAETEKTNSSEEVSFVEARKRVRQLRKEQVAAAKRVASTQQRFERVSSGLTPQTIAARLADNAAERRQRVTGSLIQGGETLRENVSERRKEFTKNVARRGRRVAFGAARRVATNQRARKVVVGAARRVASNKRVRSTALGAARRVAEGKSPELVNSVKDKAIQRGQGVVARIQQQLEEAEGASFDVNAVKNDLVKRSQTAIAAAQQQLQQAENEVKASSRVDSTDSSIDANRLKRGLISRGQAAITLAQEQLTKAEQASIDGDAIKNKLIARGKQVVTETQNKLNKAEKASADDIRDWMEGVLQRGQIASSVVAQKLDELGGESSDSSGLKSQLFQRGRDAISAIEAQLGQTQKALQKPAPKEEEPTAQEKAEIRRIESEKDIASRRQKTAEQQQDAVVVAHEDFLLAQEELARIEEKLSSEIDLLDQVDLSRLYTQSDEFVTRSSDVKQAKQDALEARRANRDTQREVLAQRRELKKDRKAERAEALAAYMAANEAAINTFSQDLSPEAEESILEARDSALESLVVANNRVREVDFFGENRINASKDAATAANQRFAAAQNTKQLNQLEKAEFGAVKSKVKSVTNNAVTDLTRIAGFIVTSSLIDFISTNIPVPNFVDEVLDVFLDEPELNSWLQDRGRNLRDGFSNLLRNQTGDFVADFINPLNKGINNAVSSFGESIPQSIKDKVQSPIVRTLRGVNAIVGDTLLEFGAGAVNLAVRRSTGGITDFGGLVGGSLKAVVTGNDLAEYYQERFGTGYGQNFTVDQIKEQLGAAGAKSALGFALGAAGIDPSILPDFLGQGILGMGQQNAQSSTNAIDLVGDFIGGQIGGKTDQNALGVDRGARAKKGAIGQLLLGDIGKKLATLDFANILQDNNLDAPSLLFETTGSDTGAGTKLLIDLVKKGSKAAQDYLRISGEVVAKAQEVGAAFNKADAMFDGLLSESINDVARTVIEKAAQSAEGEAVNRPNPIAVWLTSGLDEIDSHILQVVNRVQTIPDQIGGGLSLAANPIGFLGGVQNPADILIDVKEVFGGVATYIGEASQQIHYFTSALESVHGLIHNGPYHLLVQQNVELQQELLRTQASLVATNKILRNGVEIADPTEAIQALNAPVQSTIAKMRRDSLELVNVTSRELVEVFNIIVTQASQANIGLQESGSLTIDFAAALGTLGVPLYQANQEISSILTGQVDQNSVLGKTLGLQNEQLQRLAQQGKMYDFLSEKLSAFRAGNALAAQTIGGVGSNIKEVIEEVGLFAGEALLDPIVSELNSLYEYMFANLFNLVDYVKGLVDNVIRAGKAISDVVRSIADTGMEFAAKVPEFLFNELANGAESLAQAVSIAAVAFKPFFSVLAGLADFAGTNWGFFLAKTALQLKVLASTIGILTKSFNRLLNLIPGMGEFLFFMNKIRSGQIWNQFTSISKSLNAASAGFLIFGQNLNSIPGAFDLVASKIPIFGGAIASIIPQLSTFAIGLVGLRDMIPGFGGAMREATSMFGTFLSGGRSAKGLASLLKDKLGMVEAAKLLETYGEKIRDVAEDTNILDKVEGKFKSFTQSTTKALVTKIKTLGAWAAAIGIAGVALSEFLQRNKDAGDAIRRTARETQVFAAEIRSTWEATGQILGEEIKSPAPPKDWVDSLILIGREVRDGEFQIRNFIDVLKLLGAIIGETALTIMKVLGIAGVTVGKILFRLVEVVKNAIDGIVNAVKLIWNGLKAFGGFIWGLFTGDWSLFQSGISGIKSSLQGIVGAFVDALGNLGAAVYEGLRGIILMAWRFVDPFVEALLLPFPELKEKYAKMQEDFRDSMRQEGNMEMEVNLMDNLGDVATKTEEEIANIKKAIDEGGLDTAVDQLVEDVTQFTKNVDEGNAFPRLAESVNDVKDAFDSLREGTASVEDVKTKINALSTVRAAPRLDGMLKGLQQGTVEVDQVKRAIDELGTRNISSTPEIDGMLRSFQDGNSTLEELRDGIIQLGLIDAASAPRMQAIVNLLEETFPNGVNEVENSVINLSSALAGIEDQAALEPLREVLRGFSDGDGDIENVKTALESVQASIPEDEFEVLNQALGQARNSLGETYRGATELESQFIALNSVLSIAESDTANGQLATMRATLDDLIHAQENHVHKLQEGNEGHSVQAQQIRAHIETLKGLREQFESVAESVEIQGDPVRALERQLGNAIQTQERYTNSLVTQQKRAEAQLAQLRSSGSISQDFVDSGNLSAQRQVLEREVDLIQKNLQSMYDQYNELTDAEKGNATDLVSEINNLSQQLSDKQIALADAEISERERANELMLRSYDEQITQLEARNAQGIMTEQAFAEQSTLIQLEKNAQELQIQQEFLDNLFESDEVGRSAINARIAELTSERQKIIEDGYDAVLSAIRTQADEELSILDGKLAQGQISEAQNIQETEAIQLQSNRSQIQQLQRALSEMEATNIEGRRRINAEIGKLQQEQEEIVEQSMNRQIQAIERSIDAALAAAQGADLNRQITLQEQLNSGVINQAEFSSQSASIAVKSARDQVQASRQLQRELQQTAAFSDPVREAERQKRIQDARNDTAQATLGLLQAEKDAQEALIQQQQQRIEQDAKRIQNQYETQRQGLEAQSQALENQTRQIDLLNRALEHRNKLIQAEQDLQSARADYVAGEIDALSALTDSEYERRQLAEITASIKLQTVMQQIEFERQNLKLQQEQERIALEREKIEARIATIKQEAAIMQARADVVAQQAQLESLRLDPQATSVDIRSQELQLQATQAGFQAQVDALGATRANEALIGAMGADLGRRQAMEREMFELQARGRTRQAETELVQALPPGLRQRASRQLRDQIVSDLGFDDFRSFRTSGQAGAREQIAGLGIDLGQVGNFATALEAFDPELVGLQDVLSPRQMRQAMQGARDQFGRNVGSFDNVGGTGGITTTDTPSWGLNELTEAIDVSSQTLESSIISSGENLLLSSDTASQQIQDSGNLFGSQVQDAINTFSQGFNTSVDVASSDFVSKTIEASNSIVSAGELFSGSIGQSQDRQIGVDPISSVEEAFSRFSDDVLFSVNNQGQILGNLQGADRIEEGDVLTTSSYGDIIAVDKENAMRLMSQQLESGNLSQSADLGRTLTDWTHAMHMLSSSRSVDISSFFNDSVYSPAGANAVAPEIAPSIPFPQQQVSAEESFSSSIAQSQNRQIGADPLSSVEEAFGRFSDDVLFSINNQGDILGNIQGADRIEEGDVLRTSSHGDITAVDKETAMRLMSQQLESGKLSQSADLGRMLEALTIQFPQQQAQQPAINIPQPQNVPLSNASIGELGRVFEGASAANIVQNVTFNLNIKAETRQVGNQVAKEIQPSLEKVISNLERMSSSL